MVVQSNDGTQSAQTINTIKSFFSLQTRIGCQYPRFENEDKILDITKRCSQNFLPKIYHINKTKYNISEQFVSLCA